VEFKGNKLTIDKNDKKKASIKLTIVPGADRKAKLELTLLEGNNPISGAVKTVEWEEGVDLEITKLEYDRSDVNKPVVKFEIKNKGVASNVELELSWERKEGAKAIVNKAEKGDIKINLDATTKTVATTLLVEWDTDTHAKFNFTVKYRGHQRFAQELALARTAPKIKIALTDPAVTVFQGEGQKKVVFTITAGAEDLSEGDLKATILDYTATAGKLNHGTGDAKGKSLYALLGVATLTKNTIKGIELTIDNDNRSSVTFTDIKIKGSDNENDAAHKVAQIEWKGEIEVKLEGHDGTNAVDLTKLVGDAGKNVPIRFTNESGFNLEETELKKIVINLTGLTAGTSVKYGMTAIVGGTTTLWDILGGNLDNGETIDVPLAIENGAERSVEFTLTLEGENTGINNQVEIKWKGEIKVKIKGYDGDKKVDVDLTQLVGEAGKFLPFGLMNESGFALEEEELKKITIQVEGLPNGAFINVGSKTIGKEIKTLWDLFGPHVKILPKEYNIFGKFVLETGLNTLVNGKVIIGGENKSTDNQVDVKWEAGIIKVKLEGHDGTNAVDLTKLVGDAGKNVPIRFTNESGFNLEETELKKIVINLAGLTAGTSVEYKYGTIAIVSGTTTLWDILGGNLDNGETIDMPLAIENGIKGAVDFTLTLGGENTGTNNQVNVNWKAKIQTTLEIQNKLTELTVGFADITNNLKNIDAILNTDEFGEAKKKINDAEKKLVSLKKIFDSLDNSFPEYKDLNNEGKQVADLLGSINQKYDTKLSQEIYGKIRSVQTDLLTIKLELTNKFKSVLELMSQDKEVMEKDLNELLEELKSWNEYVQFNQSNIDLLKQAAEGREEKIKQNTNNAQASLDKIVQVFEQTKDTYNKYALSKGLEQIK
jgi:hypothetical protein